jgi:hypothetical protein
MKHERWIDQGRRLVAYWLGLSLIFLIMMLYRMEYDFGWHIAAGTYIRSHGVPLQDIYSYTAGNFAWIDHEWLHDVIISWIYNVGGYVLVAVVFALAWSAAVMLASRKSVLPILLLATEAVLPFSAARPALWGFLFFAITQRLLEKSSRVQWVVLPPLTVLWANLHGSFPLLLLLLGGAWWQRRAWGPGILLGICAALTLLNPFGWRVYEEIARSIFDPGLGRYVQEWAAFALPIMGWLYATCYALMWHEFDGKMRRQIWQLATLTAAIGSARQLPLFVAASLRSFELYALKLDEKIKLGNHGRSLAMWVIFCALAGGVVQNTWFAGHILGHDARYQMPQAPAMYLATHPCAGNVFNDYDFGGYLIWKVPGFKTYIDGRMPSWRDDQGVRYIDRYLRIIKDNDYRAQQFGQYNVKCAVLAAKRSHSSASLVSSLEKQGWHERARDDVSVLLIQ